MGSTTTQNVLIRFTRLRWGIRKPELSGTTRDSLWCRSLAGRVVRNYAAGRMPGINYMGSGERMWTERFRKLT